MEQKKASIRRKETYPQALSGCNFQGPGFYIDEAFWDLKKSYTDSVENLIPLLYWTGKGFTGNKY
jgi:hypothetical protein